MEDVAQIYLNRLGCNMGRLAALGPQEQQAPQKKPRRFKVHDQVKLGNAGNLRDAPVGEITAVVDGGYWCATHLGHQLQNGFYLRSQVHPYFPERENRQ